MIFMKACSKPESTLQMYTSLSLKFCMLIPWNVVKYIAQMHKTDTLFNTSFGIISYFLNTGTPNYHVGQQIAEE